MNDGLDTTLVLPSVGEKPSVQYRTSAYTVRQYCALPYAQRRAVDATCNEAAGLAYTTHADETSEKPYTVGRRTTATTSTTSSPPTAMISPRPYVHPAPSPALHFLNTPELIEHDAAHADNEHTSAVPVGAAVPVSSRVVVPDFATLAQATLVVAAPAPAAEPLTHHTLVYETTEYDVFHLLPENRDIDQNHVRKLVALIQQNNLLHLKPLDVTQDFGIIDGQHRWAAARELGLPIFYKVGQQLTEADISTLNLAGKNWAGTDWLKYWAVKRKPAYVALADFMQRHPRLSFSNAKIMLSGEGGGRSKADEFRAGCWDGAEDEALLVAEQVAELVARIAAEVPTFKQPAHTGFVTVLYQCVTSVEGFDTKELMRKILDNPRALVPCASHKQWLQMLGDIYNYRKNEGNRIRFE